MWKTFPREREGERAKRVFFHEGTFAKIISLDNLFLAWANYCKGKRSKDDVQKFEFSLEDNIFQLHNELLAHKYSPGKYQQFLITDPKKRVISKALVRDRLLHQAIYQILYPLYDKTFIFDSYSCRNGKGTHKAFARLVSMTQKVSRSYTAPCWALKMDIRRFFDSIDHETLLELLGQRINDAYLMTLLENIVRSFEFSPGKGMPLGNLTSQLFANIYMDPLDKFLKHKLNAKYYLRYADDFAVVSSDHDELLGYFIEINSFLKEKLKLSFHPNKIGLRKLSWGIDFVGYVALPHYQLPRNKTVKRILKKVAKSSEEELSKTLPSYLGYLNHASSHKVTKKIMPST